MEKCADCQTDIRPSDAAYFSRDPITGITRSYHSACGDALGINSRDRRIAELEAALRRVMIGGNHVALLIGADHPPYTASHEDALRHYGAGDKYEAWCCWRTIMEARTVLEKS